MKDKEKAERQKDERERREIRKRGQSERESFPLEFLHHDTGYVALLLSSSSPSSIEYLAFSSPLPVGSSPARYHRDENLANLAPRGFRQIE